MTRLAAIEIEETRVNFIMILKKLVQFTHLYIVFLTLWWLKRRIYLKQIKGACLPDFS